MAGFADHLLLPPVARLRVPPPPGSSPTAEGVFCLLSAGNPGQVRNCYNSVAFAVCLPSLRTSGRILAEKIRPIGRIFRAVFENPATATDCCESHLLEIGRIGRIFYRERRQTGETRGRRRGLKASPRRL